MQRPKWQANLVLLVIVVLLLIIGMTVWSTQNYIWRFPAQHNANGLRAAVIDALSQTYPDPSFVTNTTMWLTTAGYTVDYLGPNRASVDYFKNLPSDGYDLIIIRAHTASSQSIITVDQYDRSEHPFEQLTGSLVLAEVPGEPAHFAITSHFVRYEMQGRFQDSTIIVMGCSALQGTPQMAQAFLDKGARFFVGWDSTVSILHTDRETAVLTQWISKGNSLPGSVSLTRRPDPVSGARLRVLDWDSLVQSRMNDLISQATLWSASVALIALGPLVVFLPPKLLNSLARPWRIVQDKIGRLRSKKTILGPRERHGE